MEATSTRAAVIRRLEESDLDNLLSLYKHLHANDEPLPDRPTTESIWRQILANPWSHYLGLYVEGALVASCVLTLIMNMTRGCRPYGLIENVVTRADFRRQGLGRCLLQHALERAWQEGCYKVMLLTGRKDEATFSFYRGAGFDQAAKQAFVARPKAPLNTGNR